MRALVLLCGAAFAAERERWPLWLPVALGVGVALYFALHVEPPVWAGPAAFFGAILVAPVLRWRAGTWNLSLVLATIVAAMGAVGFSVAQIRSLTVAAPVLAKNWGPGEIRGRVRSVELLPTGKRVVFDQIVLSGLSSDVTPARVRLRFAGKAATDDLRPGRLLAFRGRLMPPPAPSAPGAFDFQRYAWFLRLGAVGFAFGPPETIESTLSDSSLWLARLRQTLSERIRGALPGTSGAVASALRTGERSAIPGESLTAMREAGLAHLLAISGLHIGLVAGLMFFGLRAGLALIQPVALRYPIKKWAAVAALIGALAYLSITGATVPTQRAFLMIALVFIAVLFDRDALSMRLVAWAATAILIFAPESLLSASFQLSFAAVIALIATYESTKDRFRLRRYRENAPPWRGPLLYLAGVALTTLVASSATSIFAVYHFNRIAMYGLAANMVAVPTMALWIMPWGLVAVLLTPLGLEGLALVPMGWGIDLVLAVAHKISGWAGSVAVIPAMPVWGLGAAVFGGLWLCLWRGRWRFLGLAGLLLAVLSVAVFRPPDILVSGDAKLFAVRAQDGRYFLSSRRKARFAAEGWRRRAGFPDAAPWPKEGPSGDDRLICDDLGCIYRLGNNIVALVRDERAIAEDCRRADLIIGLVPIRQSCPRARRVIDRFDLWREGGHAVWRDGAGFTVKSVHDLRGDRPWVPRR